jgi:hypothetical protein
MIIRKTSGIAIGEGRLGYRPERYPEGLLERATELLISGECVVPVTEPDDGCIDGRHAVQVSFLDSHGVFAVHMIDEHGLNHERYKVTGGGALSGIVGEISQGKLKSGSIDTAITHLIMTLAKHTIFVGAHTGSHGHHEYTDCGGNDALEDIMRNAEKYEKELEASVRAAMLRNKEPFDKKVFDSVIGYWQEARANGFLTGSSGASRLEAIKRGIERVGAAYPSDKPRAVIKHLDNDHYEAFYVKNYLDNKTVSQKKFRDRLHAEFPDTPIDELPQLFVLDIVRLEHIAEAISESETEYKLALTGMLLYQDAALLTLGDGTLHGFEVVGL